MQTSWKIAFQAEAVAISKVSTQGMAIALEKQ